MKINTFLIAIIFSFLASFSKQKEENGLYKTFLSKKNLKDTPLEDLLAEEEQTIDTETEQVSEEINPEEDDKETETGPEKEDEETEGVEEENEIEEYENEEKEGDNQTDVPADTDKKTYVNIKCLFVSKYNVYSLQKLTKDDGYLIDLTNKTSTKDNKHSLNITNRKLKFNFCQNLKGFESTVVLEKNIPEDIEQNKTQILFAGSIDGTEKSKNEWFELNEDNGKKGVKIRLAEGQKCNEEENHKTIFLIYCNESVSDEDFEKNLEFDSFNENGCLHYIKAKSIYGCALNQWYLLRRLMKEYKYLFAAGFVLIGLFLALWGKRFETPTIMLVCGIFVCYIISAIILNLIPSLIKTENNLWTLLVVTFVAGCIIGFLLKKKVTAFAIFMGACAGYSVSEFVYQFIAGFITANPTILYWIVFGVCILVGGLLGYWIKEAIVIIGTSLVGGYIVMRGFTLLFDNYMELAEFADLAKNGEIEQLKDIKNGWVYAYLGLWLVVSIFGIYYQCYGHKKRKAKGDDKKDDKDYKKV